MRNRRQAREEREAPPVRRLAPLGYALAGYIGCSPTAYVSGDDTAGDAVFDDPAEAAAWARREYPQPWPVDRRLYVVALTPIAEVGRE